jgi:hypothetical protein
LTPPPDFDARLSITRMSSSRTRPGDQFWMPAPASSENPSRIVSLEIVTCIAVGWISNSRSIPRCSSGEPSGGKPPSRIVAWSPVASAPTIVTESWMSKSPDASLSSFITGTSSS